MRTMTRRKYLRDSAAALPRWPRFQKAHPPPKQNCSSKSRWANIRSAAFLAELKNRANDRRLLEIVKNAGYRGYIGIEWEPEGTGKQLTRSEGIEKTKALLEKDGAALS